MAKVKLKPILEQMRGKVGDLVFKHYSNEVIVGRNPDHSSIQPTEAQLEHQEHFCQAVLYGRLVMADLQKKASYEQASKTSGKLLFSLTVADFFNAPVVDEVDLSAYARPAGDAIVIKGQPQKPTGGADRPVPLTLRVYIVADKKGESKMILDSIQSISEIGPFGHQNETF